MGVTSLRKRKTESVSHYKQRCYLHNLCSDLYFWSHNPKYSRDVFTVTSFDKSCIVDITKELYKSCILGDIEAQMEFYSLIGVPYVYFTRQKDNGTQLQFVVAECFFASMSSSGLSKLFK